MACKQIHSNIQQFFVDFGQLLVITDAGQELVFQKSLQTHGFEAAVFTYGISAISPSSLILDEFYFILRFHEFSWIDFHSTRMASNLHHS
jgi:hypothetical protein